MGFFGKSSSSDESKQQQQQSAAVAKQSAKLADSAVKDLNCEQYMEKYRQCMMDNMSSPAKRMACAKILDEFRFCLVYKEQKNPTKNQDRTTASRNKPTAVNEQTSKSQEKKKE